MDGPPMKPYLNLGCGSRFDPAWTNVDFVSHSPSVIRHDLRQGIPFGAETFDVVYHSHVLEHFPRAEALAFLQECHRVLKPSGILRVATPDLEQITRVYLRKLEGAIRGDEQAQRNYEWIILEMYDQTVRERTGGDMADYLRQKVIPNREFVLARIGVVGAQLLDAGERLQRKPATQRVVQPAAVRILRRLYRFLRDPARRREWVVQRLLGAEYELLQVGRFRRSGEIHRWMYDRYSLAQIVQAAGFRQPQIVGPTESRIPDWAAFHLDTEPDGTVYKPDSLYLEGVKE
ncbi:MAG: methyltransferase domain-containing protein [Chloroflexi bacterium]|nr:methyltransferase domain-containing protein [Chloroflexota bacterium]